MSKLQELLLSHIRALQLPEPEQEVTFALPRRWRFDLAWPDRKLAVEIQGALYVAGRHNQGAAMEKEYEKLNAATKLGWRVLVFGPAAIRSSQAVTAIEDLLRS